MSFERAYVNCNRCYQSALDHDILENIPTGDKNPLKASFVLSAGYDQIYSARNEAMRALEEENRAYSDKNVKTQEEEEEEEAVLTALGMCMTCHYERPRIANHID